jgi:hypothetical protein
MVSRRGGRDLWGVRREWRARSSVTHTISVVWGRGMRRLAPGQGVWLDTGRGHGRLHLYRAVDGPHYNLTVGSHTLELSQQDAIRLKRLFSLVRLEER